MKEADLKRTVDDYLTYMQNQGRLIFLRLNAGDFIEVRGRAGIEHRRRVKGCPPGTSDYMILMHSSIIFLELKSDKGKQTAAQLEFMNKVRAQDAAYHVIRDFEILKRIVERE